MAETELTLNRNDALFVAAFSVAVIIVIISVIWLFLMPYSDKVEATIYKETYEVVVKGGLLSVFTTLIAAKVSYTLGALLLNKFSNKSERSS